MASEDTGSSGRGTNRNQHAALEIGGVEGVSLLVSMPGQYCASREPLIQTEQDALRAIEKPPTLKRKAPEGCEYLVHIDGDADLDKPSEIMPSSQPVWWVALTAHPYTPEQTIRVVVDGEVKAEISTFGAYSTMQSRFDGDELRIEVGES